MPPMEDARASEEKYNEILNSGMPHPAHAGWVYRALEEAIS